MYVWGRDMIGAVHFVFVHYFEEVLLNCILSAQLLLGVVLG